MALTFPLTEQQADKLTQLGIDFALACAENELTYLVEEVDSVQDELPGERDDLKETRLWGLYLKSSYYIKADMENNEDMEVALFNIFVNSYDKNNDKYQFNIVRFTNALRDQKSLAIDSDDEFEELYAQMTSFGI